MVVTMIRYIIPLSMILSSAAFCDFVDTEDAIEPLVAADQNADQYDKPYSLNPVPINPRAPEPANWKDAYKGLCERIDSLDQQMRVVENKIAELENNKTPTVIPSE